MSKRVEINIDTTEKQLLYDISHTLESIEKMLIEQKNNDTPEEMKALKTKKKKED